MKSIGSFLSEITDVDNKLLRTFITLFRKPTAVVNAYLAGEQTYTKPLRYAIFTATLHIVVKIAYNYLFVEADNPPDWLVPERLRVLRENFSSFYDSFFPLMVFVTILPMAILLVKLLFFRLTWREVTVIMLYFFAQFWILMLITFLFPGGQLLIFITELVIVMIVFLCFHKTFRSKFWPSLTKWVAMTIVLIFWFNEVAVHVYIYSYVNIISKSSPTPLILPDAEPIKLTEIRAPETETFVYAATRHDPEKTLILTETHPESITLTCLTKDQEKLWSHSFPSKHSYRVTRVRIAPDNLGWLIHQEAQNRSDTSRIHKITIVSQKGSVMLSYQRPGNFILNSATIVNDKTLVYAGGIISGGEVVPYIYAVDFVQAGDSLSVSRERKFTLSGQRQRFYEIYNLKSTSDQISMLVSKYEISGSGIQAPNASEVNQISIMRISLDSLFHTNWETLLFRKTTSYSPPVEGFKMRPDTLRDRIITSYALSNDSVSSIIFTYLDTDGHELWKKSFFEDDYNHVSDFLHTDEGIYFSGSTVCGTPKHPLFRFYRLGVLGYISRDGKTLKRLRYGQFYNDVYHNFWNLLSADSTVTVLDAYAKESLFGDTNGRFVLEFSKADLKEK